MRIAVLAAGAAAIFLGGCGGPKTGQTANSSASVGNSVSSSSTDASGNPAAMAVPAAVTDKDQALKIMKVRQDGMKALGRGMKTLHRALDSSPPDINAIRAQTAAMAVAGTKIPGWFPAGTGPDVGKSRAKSEIWKQQDLFLRRSKEYLAAAQAIDAAAKAGDLNKVMALHEDVDKACKACHDPFRAPEH